MSAARSSASGRGSAFKITQVILALLTAVSLWLSAGTLAVIGGDTTRIAALPSIWILVGLVVAAVAVARVFRLRAAGTWPLAISLLLWLPFFPGSIPAAFLIWQGPIEAIVWLVVAAGLIAVKRPSIPRLLTGPATAPAIAGVILALSALLVFSQVRGVIPGGDEPHYLAATQSLLHDGDLRVANNYVNSEYLAYFPGRLEPHFLKRATSGEIYSIHAPGVSVIVLPAFAVAGYLGAILTMILIAALTAAMAWRLAWRLSGSAGASWTAVTAVFGTAPYFFHTFTIYPEIIGGFLVTAGVSLLLDLSEGRAVSTRMLIAIGSALAMLPWLHSRFAVLAGLLGVIIVIRLGSTTVGKIAKFVAVPVLAGVAWFAFFWMIWGSPSPMAPYGADTSTSPSFILGGLIGLLFDQQFGVLTTAPVYLIAVAGTFELFKRRPRLTIELLLVVVAYAITVASYQMWWAGFAAPARFLVAILPLAVMPIAAFVGARTEGMPSAVKTAGCVILLIVSVSLVYPRAFVEGGRLIFNNRAPLDATAEWLSQIVDLPLALPSVHRDGASAAMRDGAVWLTAIAIAAALVSLVKRTMAVRWTAAAFAIATTVMVSATIVWSLHGASPLTPDRSQLAALRAYRPAWQTAGFAERMAIDLPSTVRLDRVPAGEYEIMPANGAVVFVGRDDPPIESPQLDAGPFRMDSPFHLRLPVALQTLHLGLAQPSTLRPLGVIRPLASRNAIRAARYGRARAFVFDDWIYLERDGFWTRANGTADVVIDADEASVRQSGLPISITAGAVATTIRLSVGSWDASYSLAAGQKQDVVLPPSNSGAWPLRIRSGAGFRPSEREPGSRDVRLLSTWVAIR